MSIVNCQFFLDVRLWKTPNFCIDFWKKFQITFRDWENIRKIIEKYQENCYYDLAEMLKKSIIFQHTELEFFMEERKTFRVRTGFGRSEY